MSTEMSYRKQLLQAVEAFLEGTPSAYVLAQGIIQRGYTKIHNEVNTLTIDWIVWGHFFAKLTDSVYYENREVLREIQEILRGSSSQNITSNVFNEDLRSCFTTNEAEWYVHLVEMVEFILTIPFVKIHEATYQARKDKQTWQIMCANIPEATQADNIEKEYQQRKVLIEEFSVKILSPENIGDEKIYHLVLQEVTSLLTQIRVGKAAVYFGYPVLHGFYLNNEESPSFPPKPVNIMEGLVWAKRYLAAISGSGDVMFISWRLSKAPTFDGDILLVSLH